LRLVVAVVVAIFINTVRAIRLSAHLVILVFFTVTRGFGARDAVNHNLRNIYDFGLIELRFGTRRIAWHESRCFSPIVPLGWLATAPETFILAVVVAASSPPLPLVRIVVISDFIIRTAWGVRDTVIHEIALSAGHGV
jgi:hypothetical protein